MYIRKVSGIKKLSILKKPRSKSEENHNIKSNIISMDQILISGFTGSGKSVATITIGTKFADKDFTTIYVTEKKGNEFESGEVMLTPKSKLQLEILNGIGKEKKTYSAKFYHPNTFNANYNKKTIPIEFYDFSLKNDFFLESINALVGGTADNEVIRIFEDRLKKIKDDDEFGDFIFNIYNSIQQDDGETVYKGKRDDFFLPIKSSGSKTTVRNIVDSLKVFRDHFFLRSGNSKNILDIPKILNDNKNIHVFSTKWITEPRVKYFIIITLLKKIMKAMEEKKVHKNVCLIFEEIKQILPDESQVSYQAELSKIMREILSTIRAKGKRGAVTIGTTQDYFQTDKNYRSGCSCRFIGRSSPEDRTRYLKDLSFPAHVMRLISKLDAGQFIFWEEDLFTTFNIDMPSHRHLEANEDFEEEFSKEYPSLLRDHKNLFVNMKKDFLEMEKRLEVNSAKLIELHKLKLEEKKKEKKKDSTKTDEIKEKYKNLKDTALKELQQKAYEIKIKNPKRSWREIGKEIGKTHITAKDYAFKYAKQIGDDNFVARIIGQWT